MLVVERQKVMATQVALRRQQLSSNSSNNMSLSTIETTLLEQKRNYQMHLRNLQKSIRNQLIQEKQNSTHFTSNPYIAKIIKRRKNFGTELKFDQNNWQLIPNTCETMQIMPSQYAHSIASHINNWSQPLFYPNVQPLFHSNPHQCLKYASSAHYVRPQIEMTQYFRSELAPNNTKVLQTKNSSSFTMDAILGIKKS
jgi:hypothetical protein